MLLKKKVSYILILNETNIALPVQLCDLVEHLVMDNLTYNFTSNFSKLHIRLKFYI